MATYTGTVTISQHESFYGWVTPAEGARGAEALAKAVEHHFSGVKVNIVKDVVPDTSTDSVKDEHGRDALSDVHKWIESNWLSVVDDALAAKS